MQLLLRGSSLDSGSCAAQEGFLNTRTCLVLFLSMFHRVSQTTGWPRRKGMSSNNQKNFPRYRKWLPPCSLKEFKRLKMRQLHNIHFLDPKHLRLLGDRNPSIPVGEQFAYSGTISKRLNDNFILSSPYGYLRYPDWLVHCHWGSVGDSSYSHIILNYFIQLH